MSAPRDDKAGVKQTYKALTEAGYDIVVLDGAGEKHVGLNKKQAVAEATSCDEGYFLVHEKGEADHFGWVRFIYGNEPMEVINDYTTNLDHVIDPLSKKWGW